MSQASLVGFAVGGAFLSLLYFDMPYYLMAALIATRVLVEKSLQAQQAPAAQGRLAQMQGRSNIWFCGAWTRYGFHEDGLMSALDVVARLRNSWAHGDAHCDAKHAEAVDA